jgi:hypothetical protein
MTMGRKEMSDCKKILTAISEGLETLPATYSSDAMVTAFIMHIQVALEKSGNLPKGCVAFSDATQKFIADYCKNSTQ